ncbi:MAG: glycosyltransferase N-terminal domain-containing protein, partial [Acidobacteriota bacterium]
MGPENARPGLAWRASLWREQVLLALELLLVQPVRAARNGRPHRDMLRLRLGRYPEVQARGGIWIHAPAMGELTVADALVRALPPDLPVVITTG